MFVMLQFSVKYEGESLLESSQALYDSLLV